MPWDGFMEELAKANNEKLDGRMTNLSFLALNPNVEEHLERAEIYTKRLYPLTTRKRTVR